MNNRYISDVAPLAHDRVRPFDGERPYLATGSLLKNNDFEFQYVDYENKPSRADLNVKSGDIIVARMQGTNKVMQIHDGMEKIIVSTGFAVFRPNASEIDSRFLYYYMLNSKFQREKDKLCVGATQKAINNTSLKKLNIPLPKIEDQLKIVTILDKADAICRKREKAIKLADEFLRSVFLDMFGDPVVNPKGWRQVKIKEMCAVKTGNTPSRNVPEYYGDDIEWIKSDNINTPYHYLTKAEEKLSKEGRKVGRVVPANSTLVTCIAGSFDCIGNAALADRSVSFNQQINSITPSDDIDPYFLYLQILIAKRLIQAASTNSMKGMVSKSRFENIMLIKPPFKLQKKFGNIFKKFITTNDNLIQNLKNSDYLFNSLSQNAFSG